jgi:hypothetical protein
MGTTKETKPACPVKLKPNGRGDKRWKVLNEEMEFDPLEVELLAEYCATLDDIDATDSAVERRMQRAILSRLASQLAVQSDDESSAGARSSAARSLAQQRWRRGA